MRSDERSIVRPTMMSLVLALLVVGVVLAAHATAAEPLPSWNDGPARKAILEFVTRTTTPGSPDFLEPAARVAVFDNDGTLWPETPLPFQAQFVVDELKRLEGDHPEWKENPAITAALAGDVTGVLRSGPGQGMMLLEATHAGMTVDEFNDRVRRWLDTARHPVWKRPYSDLAYQPMLEVLDLLRDHGFTPYIVSGGGADFMRVWAEEVYGIPPSQVIGSNGRRSTTSHPSA